MSTDYSINADRSLTIKPLPNSVDYFGKANPVITYPNIDEIYLVYLTNHEYHKNQRQIIYSTRDEILAGNTLLSYLFRISLQKN